MTESSRQPPQPCSARNLEYATLDEQLSFYRGLANKLNVARQLCRAVIHAGIIWDLYRIIRLSAV